MRQIICDKCKKVFDERGIDSIKAIKLPYLFAASAWQYKSFDLCDNCAKQLDEEIRVTEAKFIRE